MWFQKMRVGCLNMTLKHLPCHQIDSVPAKLRQRRADDHRRIAVGKGGTTYRGQLIDDEGDLAGCTRFSQRRYRAFHPAACDVNASQIRMTLKQGDCGFMGKFPCFKIDDRFQDIKVWAQLA